MKPLQCNTPNGLMVLPDGNTLIGCKRVKRSRKQIFIAPRNTDLPTGDCPKRWQTYLDYLCQF